MLAQELPHARANRVKTEILSALDIQQDGFVVNFLGVDGLGNADLCIKSDSHNEISVYLGMMFILNRLKLRSDIELHRLCGCEMKFPKPLVVALEI